LFRYLGEGGEEREEQAHLRDSEVLELAYFKAFDCEVNVNWPPDNRQLSFGEVVADELLHWRVCLNNVLLAKAVLNLKKAVEPVRPLLLGDPASISKDTIGHFPIYKLLKCLLRTLYRLFPPVNDAGCIESNSWNT